MPGDCWVRHAGTPSGELIVVCWCDWSLTPLEALATSTGLSRAKMRNDCVRENVLELHDIPNVWTSQRAEAAFAISCGSRVSSCTMLRVRCFGEGWWWHDASFWVEKKQGSRGPPAPGQKQDSVGYDPWHNILSPPCRCAQPLAGAFLPGQGSPSGKNAGSRWRLPARRRPVRAPFLSCGRESCAPFGESCWMGSPLALGRRRKNAAAGWRSPARGRPARASFVELMIRILVSLPPVPVPAPCDRGPDHWGQGRLLPGPTRHWKPQSHPATPIRNPFSQCCLLLSHPSLPKLPPLFTTLFSHSASALHSPLSQCCLTPSDLSSFASPHLQAWLPCPRPLCMRH